MKTLALRFTLIVTLFAMISCDDPTDPVDSDADIDGTDSDADETNDGDIEDDGDTQDADHDEEEEICELQTWDQGDDGATDLSLPPSTGAVAGRITNESQLLDGLKPRGRIGDFLLANSQIAAVIEDAGLSDGYGPNGGEILDVDLVGPEGPLGQSYFNEMMVGVLPEIMHPESVSVVADGSDGGAAIIRVIGFLEIMWLIDSCCGSLFAQSLELPLMIEYVLEPDAEGILLRITVRNDTFRTRTADGLLIVLVAGDGLSRFVTGLGFDEDSPFNPTEFVGLVGEHVSYAMVAADSPINSILSVSGVQIYSSPGFRLEECSDVSADVGYLVAAGGDVTQLQAAVRRLKETEEVPQITGTVEDSDGNPIPSARVHVTDPDDNYLTMGRTDDQGQFVVEVPPGEVTLQAWADTLMPSEEITVTQTSDGTTSDITMGSVGRLAWTVVDGDGNEIPAEVYVVPREGSGTTSHPRAPGSYGEQHHPNGATSFDFSLPGSTEIPLTTGEYRVVASRGYEYEIDVADVEITAGERLAIELTLIHSVDTSGWLCGDFHIHTMYSPDSNDFAEWKVASAAANGLELPVSTDHRYISDLQPVVEEMGLTSWVQWFPGHEITTFVYGHFNAYPLPVNPDERNQGAIEWLGLDPGELFDRVRTVSNDPILQINHPRGGAGIGAYFEYVGLSSDSLDVTNPDGFSTNFDSIEVFNGSGWLENREETVRDWFNFLNHGHLVTAIGNSDSHNSERSDVGYPRNYLPLDMVPDDVTQEDLRDLVRNGQVVVGGGAFVTAETDDGVLPGGVASVTDGVARVHILVQAATWIDLEGSAELVVNGETIDTITIDESTEDPDNLAIRYSETIEIPMEEDSWFVVGVYSDRTLAPVSPGDEAFGATNAIYFDVDGDNEYRDSGRTVVH